MGSKEEPMVAYYEEKNRGMHPRVCMNCWILPMCGGISRKFVTDYKDSSCNYQCFGTQRL